MSLTARIKRPNGVAVRFRRMKFDFEEKGFARDWLDGSAFKSMFWTQLSTSFAKGEGFFVESARAIRDRVDDPKLRAEVDEFIRQEGHHTAQHLKFDRMNAAIGVDVAACRARHERNIERARKLSGPLDRLAVTAALEHLTSSLAEQILTRPYVMKGADPNVRALWSWHAAEELEHRATCYDLYTQAGGSNERRIRALVLTWTGILSTSLVNTLDLLARDGQLFTLDTLRGLAYLFGPYGLVTRLLPAYIAYFNKNFHPWQGADGTSIAEWEEQNRRYIKVSSRAGAGAA